MLWCNLLRCAPQITQIMQISFAFHLGKKANFSIHCAIRLRCAALREVLLLRSVEILKVDIFSRPIKK